MVDLLFTTDAFAPHGLPRLGVPMLLDREMRLIEPACAWLLHVALVRGRTRSQQTWRTYGEVLYDWWQTLEANGWAWTKSGRVRSWPIAITCFSMRAATQAGPTPGARSMAGFGSSRCSIHGALLAADRPRAVPKFRVALGRNRPRDSSLISMRAAEFRRSTTYRRHQAMLPRPLSPEASARDRAECSRSADRRMGGHDGRAPHGDRRTALEHASERRRAADDAGPARRRQGRQGASGLPSLAVA